MKTAHGRAFDFQYTSLVDIEEVLAELDVNEIRELNLSHNLLSGDILRKLIGMQRLMHLDLGFNRISFIPQCFSQLSGLRSLNLSHNQLFSQSCLKVLSKLDSLKRLNLSLNYFRSFPRDASFKNLNELILLSNCVESELDIVPLLQCKNLSFVDLRGCPISSIRAKSKSFLNVESTELQLVKDIFKTGDLLGDIHNKLPRIENHLKSMHPAMRSKFNEHRKTSSLERNSFKCTSVLPRSQIDASASPNERLSLATYSKLEEKTKSFIELKRFLKPTISWRSKRSIN